MIQEKDIDDLEFICLSCPLSSCNEGDPRCLYSKAVLERRRAAAPLKQKAKPKSGTRRDIPYAPGTSDYMREYLRIRTLEKNGGVAKKRGRPRQVEKV